MRRLNNNQKGFSHHFLLPVIVIIAVTVIGGYVYNKRHSALDYLKSQATAVAHADPVTLGVTSFRDITYCPNVSANKLDIFEPKSYKSGSTTTYPAVVYVHGGYWVIGNKDNNWHGIFQNFVDNKFVVVSIDYTTSTGQKVQSYPQDIQDVACAVRFLRANASKYSINPKKIGAFGDSAGGQLVSLLGVAYPSNKFDVGQYLNYSSSVQAVGDFFGPVNLTDTSFSTGLQNGIKQIFGSPANVLAASATTYVNNKRQEPPFLIMHGDGDVLIPLSQSTKFNDQLKSNGNSAQLVIVKNAGHEFSQVDGAPPMSPNSQKISTTIVDFFTKNLQGN